MIRHRSTVLLAACVTCLGWTLATSHNPGLGAVAYSLLDSSAQTIAQASSETTQSPLKLGTTGSDVKELQTQLKQLGHFEGEPDGNFTETTQTAVSKFQESVGLPADGVAGETTLSKLGEVAQAENPKPEESTKPKPKNNKPSNGSGKLPWLPVGITLLVVIVGWRFIDKFLLKWFSNPQVAVEPKARSGEQEINPANATINVTAVASESFDDTQTVQSGSVLEADHLTPPHPLPNDLTPAPERIVHEEQIEPEHLTPTNSLTNSMAPPSETIEQEPQTVEYRSVTEPDQLIQSDFTTNGVKPQPDPIESNPPIQDKNHSALTTSRSNPSSADSQNKTPDDNIPINQTTRIAKTKRTGIEKLINDLGAVDPNKRRKAIWELAQRGDSRAVQPLVNAMVDADSKQRSLILEALSQIGTKTLKPMQMALALSMQDENAEVRKNAIRDLTRVYELISQINQILSYATSDSDPEVQDTARWAMSQLTNIRPGVTFDQFISSDNMNQSDNEPN